MKIGFIGLGHMGLNMVKNLIDHDHELIVWNRSEEPRMEAEKHGATAISSIKELVENLEGKKVLFSMVSAGSVIDKLLFDNEENTISELLSEGDIFIDGVNSHYKDSIRRAKKLAEKGIKMLDAGVSGGVEGARHGACAMVGGDKESFDYVEEIFKDLTVEEGYGYFGTNGAGHFVKMVHNAIEYGMMQVIGEGLNLIDESEYKDTNIRKLLDVWNHGSIIEGNLIGFLRKAMEKKSPEDFDSEIGSLGTGRWASEDALERGVPFTAISHAVFNRYASRGTSNFAFKMIQAMRAEFGAHTSQERDSQ
ncbi:MAG TPA: decarboxylating 6-phosphogluconate dehydrogenase [Candidatus Dojkabacteria bacterium]|jgi:6-phosphogluconate dehydrogenase